MVLSLIPDAKFSGPSEMLLRVIFAASFIIFLYYLNCSDNTTQDLMAEDVCYEDSLFVWTADLNKFL